MKRILFLITLGFLAGDASARINISVGWVTFDGGGGTNAGGVFSVSGSIGQPDAGTTMTGGNFSLSNGFWSMLSVVQTA